MIEATDLTKLDGDDVAVDDLPLRGKPSRVSRFPGPNRAGKTTTKRIRLLWSCHG
jgi:ABC-type multidrug transport system ATPase subunit